MKILLVNGSPHREGCTYTALSEVGRALTECGVEWEIHHIGTEPVRGCIGCGACAKVGGVCVFHDENYMSLRERMVAADGIVIGSPVYYAGPNGVLTSLLDRVFYCSGKYFRGKPAAAVVSCRRGGASAAFDRLNKYFSINEMPIITSQYWNSVHGNTPKEVLQDEEGLQTMRTIGRNMAWAVRALSAVPMPEREMVRARTNFIR